MLYKVQSVDTSFKTGNSQSVQKQITSPKYKMKITYNIHSALLFSFSLLAMTFKNWTEETSLVVPWLRLHAPSTGGLRSIPGQGTSSPTSQLRPVQPGNKINTFKKQNWTEECRVPRCLNTLFNTVY